MPSLPALQHCIATDRFGPFTFRLGIDASTLELPLVRVTDAYQRFGRSPLAAISSELEREVLVSSVHSTNTIEGAELSEDQTAHALDLPPEQVKAEQQIRVRNIKAAYDVVMRDAQQPEWRLSVDFIRTIHAEISRGLAHEDNRPGLFRDNSKTRTTYVGDEAHGGRYKPPQYRRDIDRLMDGMIEWHTALQAADVSALFRAPLMHLYFERIHPFWDGNGRTGRAIEAALLRQAGFRYAPFAMSRFYLDEIDRYFTLFNRCRKADDTGRPHPNQDFVAFHLEGMLQVIDHLHDRANMLVAMLLFDAKVTELANNREINRRQYTIMRSLRRYRDQPTVSGLRREPWYQALYEHKTDRSRQRDLSDLRRRRLLRVDSSGRIWPGFVPGDDDFKE